MSQIWAWKNRQRAVRVGCQEQCGRHPGKHNKLDLERFPQRDERRGVPRTVITVFSLMQHQQICIWILIGRDCARKRKACVKLNSGYNVLLFISADLFIFNRVPMFAPPYPWHLQPTHTSQRTSLQDALHWTFIVKTTSVVLPHLQMPWSEGVFSAVQMYVYFILFF